MELRQLVIFCKAAEMLNFTKAGQHLDYAQSNITGQIRLLEEELKVKLFERLGRNIKLTNEGREFYDYARQILDLSEEAKNHFSTTDFKGTLNIGAAETVCVYYLPKILAKYRALYPNVKISIHMDECDKFIERLKSNSIDVALVLTDTIKAHEMAVQELHSEEIVAVVSPEHYLAAKGSVKPADFEGESLVITPPGCGYRPLILSFFEENKLTLRSIIELASVASIKQCTMAGLGIAFLPKISIKNELAQCTLKELPLKKTQIEVKNFLVYHQKKWLSPAIRGFIALCDGV